MLLARVAEQLYWAARYVERAEGMARVVGVHTHLLVDLPTSVPLTWEPLLDIPGLRDPFGERGSLLRERHIVGFLLADPANRSSVLACVTAARDNLRSSREVLPREAWQAFNDLYLYVASHHAESIDRRHRGRFVDRVVAEAQRFNGTLAGCMGRDSAYQLLDLGRQLERADMACRVLQVRAVALMAGTDGADSATSSAGSASATGPDGAAGSDGAAGAAGGNGAAGADGATPAVPRVRSVPAAPSIGPAAVQTYVPRHDDVQWAAVLRSLSAEQAYRRRPVPASGRSVVEFLLHDATFPASIRHCLDQVAATVAVLPRSDAPRAAARGALQALADVPGGEAVRLDRGLDELQSALHVVHEQVEVTWFPPPSPPPLADAAGPAGAEDGTAPAHAAGRRPSGGSDR